jgi:lipopolysaccharide transport system ATP-binding protein
VKAIGDRALWLEHGHLIHIGETDRVVAKYLAAMVEKDSTYQKVHHEVQRAGDEVRRAPEIVDTIPNIDHRYGDGRAEVLGIAVLDEEGRPLHLLEPASRIVVRISVRARGDVALPVVGFMLRNQLGMDFAGSNTAREGYELAPLRSGDIVTVDFHVDLPELYPGSFSLSPAIADGTLTEYQMCDWIDNAIALQMARSDGQIYGYLHMPCKIEVNGRLRKDAPEAAPLVEKPIG